MKGPLINILTRTSGRPKCFKRCVDSVKSQTYQNINHIVGADDDESYEYASELCDNVVKLEKGVKNSEYGVAHAPYNLYINKLLDEVEDGYKVPLIASNVGCYSETIENGKTGYLIDPDAPKSEWVKVLSKCIRSPKHVYEMGENLHSITEQYFNINTVVGYRLELYEQAISMVMSRNPENITYNKDWTYE